VRTGIVEVAVVRTGIVEVAVLRTGIVEVAVLRTGIVEVAVLRTARTWVLTTYVVPSIPEPPERGLLRSGR